MSLYLGKIHYWLFNKILWFEGLETEIVNLAKNEGLDVDSLIKEINGKYGDKLPNIPLENMIDTQNIHGWLQSKINAAEGRMAAWVAIILNYNKELYSKIENIYTIQGINAAKELKDKGIEINEPQEVFNAINDYILDGMPCDRVNEVIKEDENSIEWIRRICVHSDIWEKENCNVDIFYNLRKSWIEAFVNEISSRFKYNETEDGVKAISRI
jgi:hypothetical protein